MWLTNEQMTLVEWVADNCDSLGAVPRYMWGLLPRRNILDLFPTNPKKAEAVPAGILEEDGSVDVGESVAGCTVTSTTGAPDSEREIEVAEPEPIPVPAIASTALTFDPWSNVMEDLKRALPTEHYESFFAQLHLEEFENRIVVISTVALSTQRFLEDYYFDFLCAVILRHFPDTADVVIGHRVTKPNERHIRNAYKPVLVAFPAPSEFREEVPEKVPELRRVFKQVTPTENEDGSQEPGLKRVLRDESVMQVVGKHYNVAVEEIKSSRRHASWVRARQIAMYLVKTFRPHRSDPEIGRRFGGRDHTTVLHARRKIEKLRHADPSMAQEIGELISEIQAEFEDPRAVSQQPSAETTAIPEAAE